MRVIVAPSLFELQPNTSLGIDGSIHVFPVNRVFCVGRNYAEHAAEMGNTRLIEVRPFISQNPHNPSFTGIRK